MIFPINLKGNVRRSTFTEFGKPKLAFIAITLKAFEVQGVRAWDEDFTAATKREVMEFFGLEKEPMALSTFYKTQRASHEDPSILGRMKAWEFYLLGIKFD